MDRSDLPSKGDLEKLVTRIVISYVKRNQLAPADLGGLITIVYESLKSLGKAPQSEAVLTPAVPIRQSVKPDHVVCLECGRRGQTLRGHIAAMHALSPEQYRSRWQLSPQHPLTAPAYSKRRSELAKQIGLGQRIGSEREA